jgi:hypothetical protein
MGVTAGGHPESSHGKRVTQLGLARPTPCGTRARNLRIRSPTPCPLGQGGLLDVGAEGNMSSRSCFCCPCHLSVASDKATPRGFELPRAEPAISLTTRTLRRSQSRERPADGTAPQRTPKRGQEDRRPTNGGMALPRVSLLRLAGRAELAPQSWQGKRTRCVQPCVPKRREGSRLLGLVA